MWEYLTWHVIQKHSGRPRQQSLWFFHIRPPAKPRSASPQIIWRAALRFESGAQKAARALARATIDVDRGCLNMTHHPLSLTLPQIDSVRNIFTTKNKTKISQFFENRDLSRTNENRNIQKMMLDSKPEIYKPENFIKTIPEKVNTETQI